MTSPDVLVVGSVNQDLVVRVDRLPRPGETLLGQQQPPNPGGKGANQAVGVARLGSTCALVGAVGADAAGDDLARRLASEGVNVDHLSRHESAPTGAAFILVDRAGENTIVVSPGANSLVDEARASSLSQSLLGATVTLMQLEIPISTVAEVARRARGTVILNPAPALGDAIDILDSIDVIVPNEHELLTLVGRCDQAQDEDAISRAASELSTRLACVVTLGSKGALVAEGGTVSHVAAFPTEVVDTTGAGDAFCAGVAVALADSKSLLEAVRWGAAAGALAVRALGAQAGLPSRHELCDLLATSRC